MSMIGRLAVAVLGDISGVKKSFGETKKEARSLKKDMKAIDGELRAISRSMVMMGTVIVGSMTAMVLKSTQAANAADKLAKQTGLTREQVQELGYAADQEHASMEQLSNSLVRLSRYMLDTSQGIGEARRAFDRLGINVTDANGNLRSASDVLLEISDRFKDMTNETEISALAMQLFGRSGANIVPFLQMGGDEIRKLTQEARDLGYVMDEETVKGLKRLDDQLTATKAGFAGVGRQITADVLPGYLKLADAAVDFFKWLNQTNPELRTAVTQITALGGVTALLSGTVFLLYLNLKKAATAAAALNVAFAPFLIGGVILAGLGAIAMAFLEIRDNARLAKTEIEELTDAELEREEQRIKEELDRKRRLLEEAKKAQSEAQAKPTTQRGDFAVSSIYESAKPDLIEEEIRLLEERLDKLIKTREEREKGAKAVQDEGDGIDEVADIMNKLRNELDAVEPLAKIFGTQNEIAADKAAILERAIQSLVKKGVNPCETELGDLVEQYRQYSKEAEKIAREELLKRYYDEHQDTLEKLIRTEETLSWLRGEVLDQEKLLTIQLQEQEALMKKYINEGVKKSSAEYIQLAQAIKLTVDELEALRKKQKEMQATQDLIDSLKGVSEQWERDINIGRGFDKAIAEALGQPFDDVQSQIDATIDAIRNLSQLEDEDGNPLFTADSPDVQSWLNFLKRLSSQQKSEFDIMLDNMGDWSKHMNNIAQTTAESMADMFSDFFFDPMKASFADFLDSIRRAIADMLGQAVTSWILRSVGFTPDSIFGGGRATGGPVTPGVIYRVNEREPELFKSHQSGEVVPLSRMGVTADVDVIIQNQTGVPIKAEKQSVTVEGQRVVARLLMKAIEGNTEGINDILGVRR